MQLALTEAQQRLAQHRPQRCWWRPLGRQSAVALLLRESSANGLEVLMIRRAERAGDPWSGQMGFPGGRRDPQDPHLLAVAQRETAEEIGVDLDHHAELIAPLSVLRARPWRWQQRPMTVTPYVFAIQNEIVVEPNYEVADVLWLPLAFIADHRNRQLFDVQRQGVGYRQLPCYEWREQRIWGMSLRMLDELIMVLT
jgi:8-oxo-dGTP pyrophosphatase MutT (NUDIX family)